MCFLLISAEREKKSLEILSIAHHQKSQPSKATVNDCSADMIVHPLLPRAEALGSALHVELPLNSSQLVSIFSLSFQQRL